MDHRLKYVLTNVYTGNELKNSLDKTSDTILLMSVKLVGIKYAFSEMFTRYTEYDRSL